MNVEIEKALLAGLNTNAECAMLTGKTLTLSAAAEEYLSSIAARTFASDEARECNVKRDCSYEDIFTHQDDNFIAVSTKLAQRVFDIMRDAPAIPAADMVFMLLRFDGIEHFAALKLNYKSGFIYAYNDLNEGELQRYETMLTPQGSKADEAFFIDLASREAKILEKKHDIDGSKSVYISTKLLECKLGHTPKEKLAAVCDAAIEVNRQFYQSLGVDDAAVAKAVSEEYREADGGGVCASEVCSRLYKDLPHAKEAFAKALAEQDVPFDEAFTVSAPAVRKMEKQSLRSGSGVEIKVPVSVYKDISALEFIKDEDGTTSLLIKNVLI